eukprot:5462299-Prymnesium_polylepis.1
MSGADSCRTCLFLLFAFFAFRLLRSSLEDLSQKKRIELILFLFYSKPKCCATLLCVCVTRCILPDGGAHLEQQWMVPQLLPGASTAGRTRSPCGTNKVAWPLDLGTLARSGRASGPR